MNELPEGARLQMRLDITKDEWEDLDAEKMQRRLDQQRISLSSWVVERNKLAGAVTHRIVGDIEGAAMYKRGMRESTTNHRTEAMDDLDYWDRKLGHEKRYTDAFLDGWTDGATGEGEFAALYVIVPIVPINDVQAARDIRAWMDEGRSEEQAGRRAR